MSLLVTVGCTALLPAAGIVRTDNGTSDRLLARALGHTGNLLSNFLDRSPGERGRVQSSKGGKEKATDRLGRDRPTGPNIPANQRALGKTFEPSDTIPGLADRAMVPFSSGPFADEDLPAPAELISTPSGSIGSPAGLGPGGGAGGIFSPPFGSTAPERVPSASHPPPLPPIGGPVPAVPEPGTWALLCVGFGLLSAAMRRRRRSSISATSPYSWEKNVRRELCEYS